MRLIATGLAGLAVLAAGVYLLGQPAPEPRPTRVLVFGVDGATWDVLDPMIREGELPNFERFYRTGVRGVLRSRAPALSPVVWSTIFTGHLHQRHGVRNWKTSQSSHRKVKALWEITSEAGLRTHVLNVPSTWPPTPVNGVMISGFPLSGSTLGGNTGDLFTLAALEERTTSSIYRLNREPIVEAAAGLGVGQWSDWFTVRYPARKAEGVMILKRIDEERYYGSPFYRTDTGLVITHPADLFSEETGRLRQPYIPEGAGWSKHRQPETAGYLYEHLVQVSRIQTAAAAQLVVEDWDLFIYVNTLVDRVSHPYWAYMEPESFPELEPERVEAYREAVRDAYRETDRQLGELVAGITEPFYFVVFSDHGFGPSNDSTNPIGTHRFEGVYLVSGPGLPSIEGPELNIEDSTPTVLYLLGMPSAEDITGRMLPHLVPLLGPARVKVATYEGEVRSASDIPVDEQTWEQLRGLGYVDGAPPRRD